MQHFRANGKLLLSAEYGVLFGARALALPLRFGQQLTLSKSASNREPGRLYWKALDHKGKPWLETSFTGKSLDILHTSDKDKAAVLQSLLRRINNINPDFFEDIEVQNYHFTTELEFDRHWGWGTSSTLVSLLSQCTDTDAYDLYRHSFKGSGYDLACAEASGPIYFQRNGSKIQVKPAPFNPKFKERIHFGYLGQKQNSLTSISGLPQPPAELIDRLSQLTEQLIRSQDNEAQFCQLIREHEEILSDYLNQAPISSQYQLGRAGVGERGVW